MKGTFIQSRVGWVKFHASILCECPLQSPNNGTTSSPSEDNTDDKYDGAYYTNEPLPNKPAPKAFNRYDLLLPTWYES